jgi:hypothetical protein
MKKTWQILSYKAMLLEDAEGLSKVHKRFSVAVFYCEETGEVKLIDNDYLEKKGLKAVLDSL